MTGRIAATVAAAVSLAMAGGVTGLSAGSGGNLNRILEFRGYINVAGDWSFSIHNKETGRGEWLREGEKVEGYEIVRFDRDQFQVVVRHQGQTATLHLQGAQIKNYVPSRPESPPPTPPPGVSRSANQASGGAELRQTPAANTGPSGDGGNRAESARSSAGRENPQIPGGFLSRGSARNPGGGSPGGGTPPGSGESPPPSGLQPDPGEDGSRDDGGWQTPGPPPGPPPSPVPSYDPDE